LPLVTIIQTQQKTNNIEILPIELDHALAISSLPPHHKDPFDRMLIVQSVIEGATLISRDTIFSQYPVQVIW